MCDLIRPRRSAVVAHVTDDHRPVAEAELRSMILSDPNTLDKPESTA
jgi:hypothetical protein